MRLRFIPILPKEPSNWRDWYQWFAWRPIIIDGQLIWLETIERRFSGLYPPTIMCPYDYRLPDDSNNLPS